MKIIKGKTWIFGDLIDTDLIIPHAYLATANPEELVTYLRYYYPSFKIEKP